MAAMGLNIYIFDIETGITNKIINSGVGTSLVAGRKVHCLF